jgi:hypothetical protein
MPDVSRLTIEAKINRDESVLTAAKLPKATVNKAYISYTAFDWGSRCLNGFGFRRTDNNLAVFKTLENTALNLGHKSLQIVGSNLEPVEDETKAEGVSVVYKKRMEDYDKDIEDIDAVSIEADFFKDECTFEWDGKDYEYEAANELGLVDAVEFFGGTGYVDEKQVTMWVEMREMVGLALVLTSPAFPSAKIDQIAAEKVGGENLNLVEQLKAATIGQSQYYEVLSKAVREDASIWAMLGGKSEYDWMYLADHTASQVIVRAKGSYWQMDYKLGEEEVTFSDPVEMVAAYVPKTEMVKKEGGNVLAENTEKSVTFNVDEYNEKMEAAKAEAIKEFEEKVLPVKVNEAVTSAMAEYEAKQVAYAAAYNALNDIMPIADEEKETVEATVRAEGFDVENAKKDRMIAKLQKELADKNATPSTQATATVIVGGEPTKTVDTNVNENPYG